MRHLVRVVRQFSVRWGLGREPGGEDAGEKLAKIEHTTGSLFRCIPNLSLQEARTSWMSAWPDRHKMATSTQAVQADEEEPVRAAATASEVVWRRELSLQRIANVQKATFSALF